MSIVGSYTDIEKVDLNVVNKRIAEFEKRIDERRKGIVSLYNKKLGETNTFFLGEHTKSQQKDDVCLAYLKKVKELHTEFQEKY